MRCASLIADAAHFNPGETSNRCKGLSEINTVEINPEKKNKKNPNASEFSEFWCHSSQNQPGHANIFALLDPQMRVKSLVFLCRCLPFWVSSAKNLTKKTGRNPGLFFGLTVVPVTAFIYIKDGIKKGLTVTLTR